MKDFKVTLVFEYEENGKEKQQEYSFIYVSEKKPQMTYKGVRSIVSRGIDSAIKDGFYSGKNKVSCHTVKSIEEVK